MMNTITLTEKDIHTGPLVLVNADHPVDASYETKLVSVESDYADIFLNQKAATVLANIFQTIDSEDFIVPVSGYRQQEEQKQIYEDSLKENGSEFTDKYVSLPGHSEHQTGLAIDLGLNKNDIDFICPDFPYEGVCQRFRREAVKYGFIERYPEGKENITKIAPEPWHFRYVGFPHSEVMRDKNLALEEYVDYIRGFVYRKKHLRIQKGTQEMEVFYISAGDEEEMTVTLPEYLVYQISGNNVDGFIVTVWRRQHE